MARKKISCTDMSIKEIIQQSGLSQPGASIARKRGYYYAKDEYVTSNIAEKKKLDFEAELYRIALWYKNIAEEAHNIHNYEKAYKYSVGLKAIEHVKSYWDLCKKERT